MMIYWLKLYLSQMCLGKRISRFLKALLVTPFFKKGNRISPDNYCPISVLMSSIKVFEKLLHCRLISFIESCNLLTPFRYGFWKQKYNSCCNELTETIIKAFYDKSFQMNGFFNISKDLDCMNHDILVRNIELWCVINKLICSYITNRNQVVKIGNIHRLKQEKSVVFLKDRC